VHFTGRGGRAVDGRGRHSADSRAGRLYTAGAPVPRSRPRRVIEVRGRLPDTAWPGPRDERGPTRRSARPQYDFFFLGRFSRRLGRQHACTSRSAPQAACANALLRSLPEKRRDAFLFPPEILPACSWFVRRSLEIAEPWSSR